MVHGVNAEREQTDNGEQIDDGVDGLWGAIEQEKKRCPQQSQIQIKCQRTFSKRNLSGTLNHPA